MIISKASMGIFMHISLYYVSISTEWIPRSETYQSVISPKSWTNTQFHWECMRVSIPYTVLLIKIFKTYVEVLFDYIIFH